MRQMAEEAYNKGRIDKEAEIAYIENMTCEDCE